ncbi:hypothetical protein ZIOFF_020989 [Zingiber officinale]|uniref:Nudix hydrolase domain-containing protein n=1 Tax=Zingiber officinale TaxID=94328 RepID=A0A8J5LJB9_ZINOF|nr:hypothetical protein ZIOFF_020989 [Zingiber officinale]
MRTLLSRITAGLTAAALSAFPFPSPPNLLFFVAEAAALSALHLSKPPSPLIFFPRLAVASTTLSDWIRPHLPFDPVASRGAVPGTKSLSNLWLEINHGETNLELQPNSQDDARGEKDGTFTVLPVVNVAIVRIRNTRGEVLVESHQLLSDDTVRHRSRPLSEKMMPGEVVEEAAQRAVREELRKMWYILHSVDAEVEGLPEVGEFSSEENGEGVEAVKAVFVWKAGTSGNGLMLTASYSSPSDDLGT